MAIAFNGTQPNTPNAAYTRLPYAVLDTAPTGSQFAYYMDVFESGSATRISRLTQEPNPADAAIFDPSRVFQGRLSEDENWKITGSIDLVNSAKTFDLKVGNATSISATGSLTFNPYQVSQSINVGMAVVEPNTGTFNLINPAASTTSLVLTNTVQNMPLFLDEDDYATISLLNVSSQILAVSCSYSNVYMGAVTSSYFTVDAGFTSIPIGGKNNGAIDWEKLVVDVDFSGGRPTQTYTYLNYAGPCKEKIRFAWINKLGAWDYYNVYNPVRRSSDIQREIVVEPRVDYSSATSTYDISRRGENQYYSSYSDTFTVHTGFVDKTEAQWLEELIESPTVYMQRNNGPTGDGEFVPVIIRNSTYRANTSTARQKLYEYVIEFEPSTTPWGEWVPETIGGEGYITPTPTPTPTPTATPTPLPTDTPAPTATNTPVPTATPTATPTPTPNPTNSVIISGLDYFYTAYEPGNKTTVTGSLEWHESHANGPTGSVGEANFASNVGGEYFQSASIGDLTGTADYWSNWGNCTSAPENCSKPVDFHGPFSSLIGTGSKDFTLQLYFRPGDSSTAYTNALISMGSTNHDENLNVGISKPVGVLPAEITVWAKGDLGDYHVEAFPSMSFNSVPVGATFHTLTVKADNVNTIKGLDFYLDEGVRYGTTDNIFQFQDMNIPVSSDNFLGYSNLTNKGRQPDLSLMFYAVYDRPLTTNEITHNHRYFVSQSQGLL